MGSVDRDLAVNTLGTDGTTPNTVALYGQVSLTRRGTIKLAYPNQLSDLSETFRPDLAGTALIDVQGNIQSFRGLSANGLVLNNTGNLNLLKTGRITNSTILAQPVGHIQAPIDHRSNVLIISSTHRHQQAAPGHQGRPRPPAGRPALAALRRAGRVTGRP